MILKIFAVLICNILLVVSAKECNNGLGRCVKLNQCKSKSVNNAVPMLDISENASKPCDHYMEVCCAINDITSEKEGQSAIVNSVNNDRIDQCIQQCRITDKPFGKINVPPKIDTDSNTPTEFNCGHSNPEGIGFSVPYIPEELRMTNAQFAEFPWHLALIEKIDDNQRKYLCGASLINPSVALTAAHCIQNITVDKLIVRAGEWDTQTTNEPFPHVNHNVISAVVHPHFNSSNMHNDIALLYLQDPVKLSVHINTICLPPPQMKVEELTECFGTGWGVDEFFLTGYFRANLKKIKLPIVQKANCQKLLRSTKLGDKFKLDSSFMCAGGEKKLDLCSGDGGGGLVCKISQDSNVFVQVGELTSVFSLFVCYFNFHIG